MQFYLRLANYVQDRFPIYIIGKDVFGNITKELRRQFFVAGSSKVQVQQASRLPNTVTEDSRCVLILESLVQSRALLTDSPFPRVIFDMEDIAVAFCDPKRYKTIYKINL